MQWTAHRKVWKWLYECWDAEIEYKPLIENSVLLEEDNQHNHKKAKAENKNVVMVGYIGCILCQN